MQYYKCVRIAGAKKKMLSSWAYPPYEVEYFVDKWVRPEIGKLFVFGELDSAREYSDTFFCSIFECDVENPEIATVMATSDYEGYWGGKKVNVCDCLANVFYCDAIKLTKKI